MMNLKVCDGHSPCQPAVQLRLRPAFESAEAKASRPNLRPNETASARVPGLVDLKPWVNKNDVSNNQLSWELDSKNDNRRLWALSPKAFVFFIF